jgi:hypothetical protein
VPLSDACKVLWTSECHLRMSVVLLPDTAHAAGNLAGSSLEAQEVCAFITQLLWRLPRPLIGQKTRKKLATAAHECTRRPGALQDVALYVAATAVKDIDLDSGLVLLEAAPGGIQRPLSVLLCGIIDALRTVAARSQVCLLCAVW